MSSTLLILTALAFALGMGLSWWQTRRRIRREITDRLVAEGEKRLRAEILARVREQAAQGVRQSADEAAGDKPNG